MPNNIYSKIDKDLLLLSINRYDEISHERTDITPCDEILQSSVKKLELGLTFPAHKHNKLERITFTTQEAWVIIEGKIKASFYDIDDSLLHTCFLKRGDMAVVYKAGHSFEVVEKDTILYEFKNGPYYGKVKDKTMI
jgi:hypothetical protein